MRVTAEINAGLRLRWLCVAYRCGSASAGRVAGWLLTKTFHLSQ